MPTFTQRISVGGGGVEFRTEQDGTSYSAGDSDLRMWASTNVSGTGSYNCGFLFTSVTIANGATIDSASIDFTLFDDDDSDSNGVFYGWAIGDATAPTNQSEADSIFTELTTASVSWVEDDTVSSVGEVATSPELKTIVQEIVNQVGWSSGNDMMICWVANNDVARRFKPYTSIYDNANATTLAPEFTATYTESSASSIPAIMHHRRLMGVS